MIESDIRILCALLDEIKYIKERLIKFDNVYDKQMYIHYQAKEIGNTHTLMTIDKGCKDLIIDYYNKKLTSIKEEIKKDYPTFVFADD